jgi:hypothetical protein
MTKQVMNVKLAIAALGALGVSGLALGCSTNDSANDVGSTEAAVKAASPACTSARDACKSQVQSIAAGIESACSPIESACGDHHPGGARDGGTAGSAGDCQAARTACQAAVLAAKPALEAAGASCETSIRQACVVDLVDGGVLGGKDHDHDGGRADDHGGDHDGGLGLVESAACESAETACRQSLESLKTMPPATCATIGSVCVGQTPSTVTDACKTAISDCRDALTMTATNEHALCGSDIVTACSAHGG